MFWIILQRNLEVGLLLYLEGSDLFGLAFDKRAVSRPLPTPGQTRCHWG